MAADPFEELSKYLGEYGDEAVDVLQEEAEKAAKNAVKKLKSTSPKKSGKYAKGWRSQVERTPSGAKVTVYNGKKPQIAHLLEHGHATRNGTGRTYQDTPAHVHIAPVNDETQEEFIRAVESRLSR